MRQVVVVGGGITGLGVARDLALRGFEVTVLERGEIGCETSTHFHGMLHSGARYAVKDPYAAEKCMQEKRVLRRIAEPYIEKTGGVFVKLEQDSEEYYRKKVEACRECGIPVEELSMEELVEEAGNLSDEVEKGFKVPDAVLEPEKILQANVKSAEGNGAEIIEHAEVREFSRSEGGIESVKYRKDDEVRIEAELFVNATGPWAGKTAEMADLKADMSPTRGIMTVTENPGVGQVVNRCRPTDDGDILLPYRESLIIGTTSEEVEDPDDFEKPSEEEVKMLEEAAEVLEAVEKVKLRGSYWGLRPLYNPSGEGGREATREFHLIDHAMKDGVDNLLTVVGGKWTTYRYMAEKTADRVCEKLGVDESCRTAELPLPKVSKEEVKERKWPPPVG